MCHSHGSGLLCFKPKGSGFLPFLCCSKQQKLLQHLWYLSLGLFTPARHRARPREGSSLWCHARLVPISHGKGSSLLVGLFGMSEQRALVISLCHKIDGLQYSEAKKVFPGRCRDEGHSPGFLQEGRGRISHTALSTKSLSCCVSVILRGAFARGRQGKFSGNTRGCPEGYAHEGEPPSSPSAPCLRWRTGRAGRALGGCQPRAWQPAALPASLPCRRGGRCEHHVLGEGTSCWQLQK